MWSANENETDRRCHQLKKIVAARSKKNRIMERCSAGVVYKCVMGKSWISLDIALFRCQGSPDVPLVFACLSHVTAAYVKLDHGHGGAAAFRN
ncbi:hypothetical protein F2P81_015611 [Scophthalmus maximus]|uniref:Uncharacterized protein n=1 Tax=Scophthalmus maximus TaxID=52904 RepID=A0A6A4S769_SCOMX|nr:hypothetical protein F2P81_015611 [Scophthalmus maximus]